MYEKNEYQPYPHLFFRRKIPDSASKRQEALFGISNSASKHQEALFGISNSASKRQEVLFGISNSASNRQEVYPLFFGKANKSRNFVLCKKNRAAEDGAQDTLHPQRQEGGRNGDSAGGNETGVFSIRFLFI